MVEDGPSRRAGSRQAPADEPPGRAAALAALRLRLAALRPDLAISPAGYLARLEDNLLPGVVLQQFVEDLEKSDGRELEAKFLAIHSSAALAVNAFARFKDAPGDLALAGRAGFETLAFELKCPTGLRGGRAPNLDLVAQGPAGVVAVESKCTEHLQPKAARFSPAYGQQIRDERRAGAWFRAMATVRERPERFRLLDVAQLIKHAFGLARCFKGQPTTLLYLYWEPIDAARQPLMLAHRLEVARFARLVRGGVPAFHAQSYRELWDDWQQPGRPSWLQEHALNLRARYAVSLGAGPQDWR